MLLMTTQFMMSASYVQSGQGLVRRKKKVESLELFRRRQTDRHVDHLLLCEDAMYLH